MILEFHKLEYHGKLDFTKFEYKKSGRFLHIFETVVDCNIFYENVVFGYFRLHIAQIRFLLCSMPKKAKSRVNAFKKSVVVACVRLNLINHLVGFIPCQICLYFSN